jgi:AraC family transcriptional regulator
MAMAGTNMPEIDFSGISVYPPGSTYGPHVATAHELVWVEEGSARATTAGGTLDLRPGSVLISPAGSPIHYAWDPRVTTRHGFVLFRADHVDPQTVDLPTGDVVLALLQYLVHLDGSRPSGWYADAQHVLAVALRALVVPRTSKERLLSPVVAASLAAVRARWPSRGPWPAVPLGDLAAAAAVTPEHLCRAWTKDVGMSPVAALSVVRLYRAAFLLSRSNLAVGEVARVAGFESPFHFSRAFKSALGSSPTLFRTTGLPPSEVPAGLRAVMAQL